jgi:hypothetical protein
VRLGPLQGLSLRQIDIAEMLVERCHEIGRCGVVDLPQSRQGAPRAGFQGGAGEADRRTIVAHRRFTGAEHDQIHWLIAEPAGPDQPLQIIHSNLLIKGEKKKGILPDTDRV